MRVTTNIYPETLKYQLQYLQGRQLTYQSQIATGLRIQKSSEDPLSFSQSQALSATQSVNRGFLKTTQEAKSVMEANYKAMTDMNRLLTRASELAIRSAGLPNPQDVTTISVEMESILSQIVSVANRTYDGRYLFGGTGNIPPVVQTVSGVPATYEYNNQPLSGAPNTPDTTQPPAYVATVTKVEIISQSIFETGILAGRTAVAGAPFGRPAFNGFMVDSGSGIDILQIVSDMRDDLAAGIPINEVGIQAVNQAIDLNAQFVGKTASSLSALELNKSTIDRLLLTGTERIDSETGASITDALTELNRTQLHYQAALQSGAKILNLTLLDFLR